MYIVTRTCRRKTVGPETSTTGNNRNHSSGISNAEAAGAKPNALLGAGARGEHAALPQPGDPTAPDVYGPWDEDVEVEMRKAARARFDEMMLRPDQHPSQGCVS